MLGMCSFQRRSQRCDFVDALRAGWAHVEVFQRLQVELYVQLTVGECARVFAELRAIHTLFLSVFSFRSRTYVCKRRLRNCLALYKRLMTVPTGQPHTCAISL